MLLTRSTIKINIHSNRLQEVYKQAVRKQEETVSAILKQAAKQEESMQREMERRNKARHHRLACPFFCV